MFDALFAVCGGLLDVPVTHVVDGGIEAAFVRVLALMAMVITPVAFGCYVVFRRAGARRARELAAERLRADRLAERERIVLEVHHIVAQHVGAMVLRANAARYVGADGPAAEALTDIGSTGSRVLEDLRGLLASLRDPGEHTPAGPPEDADLEGLACRRPGCPRYEPHRSGAPGSPLRGPGRAPARTPGGARRSAG